MPPHNPDGPMPKRDKVAVAWGVEETKKEVPAAFWYASELPRALPEVQSGTAFVTPLEEVVTQVPVEQVGQEMVEVLDQTTGARAVTDALVMKLELFDQVRVLPVKERPVPPKVVVVKRPVLFAESSVFVAREKMVLDWNVAVAPWVKEPVQVTELATVTKPEPFERESVFVAVETAMPDCVIVPEELKLPLVKIAPLDATRKILTPFALLVT